MMVLSLDDKDIILLVNALFYYRLHIKGENVASIYSPEGQEIKVEKIKFMEKRITNALVEEGKLPPKPNKVP